MADDIVTRLRENCGHDPEYELEVDCQHCEAATEIEFWREQHDTWRNVAKIARKAWFTETWLEFNDAYVEAVRGDA